jgi:sugar phosphate isomerase/epimerase
MSKQSSTSWTVFTKPWRGLSLGELASIVRSLGFDGVELPVRPGFQVEPGAANERLPEAVKVFANEGLEVASVAGTPTPGLIEACASNGVGIVRICIEVPRDRGYMEHEAHLRRWLDSLVPDLSRCSVRLGIQNHYGDNICNAMGLRHLLEGYDPSVIGAVWDGAHCGLDGELPHMAADILWPYLCLVNLKNAKWERAGTDAFGAAQWKADFVPGPDGLCSWPEVLAQLVSRGYSGHICLTAEYTDETNLEDKVRADLAWAKHTFDQLSGALQ